MIEKIQATISDIDSLSQMESKYFHCPWTKKQFEDEMTTNAFSHIVLLKDNNELVGYIDYWIIFDQAQINKICIDEKYRRNGLAESLIKGAFEEMKVNEVLSVSLEVRISNEKAINLYKKLGFETILTKKNYYTDGEDAYFMIKGGYDL